MVVCELIEYVVFVLLVGDDGECVFIDLCYFGELL